MNKTILSIDASCAVCSIALLYNKKISSTFEKNKKNQTKKILIMISKIFKSRKISLKLVDAITFTIGPGNFTGIRAAINVAQSLALGTNIKLFPLSTLVVIAEQAWRKLNLNKVLVLLNANNNQVYWGKYIRNNEGIWEKIKKENLITKSELSKKINFLNNSWTIVGNFRNEFFLNSKIKINKKIFFSKAIDAIYCTQLNINKNKNSNIKKIFPNYLNSLGL
ncbi:tRNA (adenosine(37)-N6)-threonylcarbamoyltransferase complex dimerization subunit type 1 TsaB [Buchnera aphidicola (Mindarus keteleerifoliae)]|uniref:tRNA (adenosine(37)-N6)-threonylcarbamoyltransferase complex dimerization subunit type 1 TsaB n=1 Tax=Buchnera aphidicola TaxID=9 RepID=UPI0031B7092D